MKDHEKGYTGYKSDHPALSYDKVNYDIKADVKNVQVTLVIPPTTPMVGPPELSCPQDIWFDARCPWSRSTPSIQQTIFQCGSQMRFLWRQPTNLEGGDSRSCCETGLVH